MSIPRPRPAVERDASFPTMEEASTIIQKIVIINIPTLICTIDCQGSVRDTLVSMNVQRYWYVLCLLRETHPCIFSEGKFWRCLQGQPAGLAVSTAHIASLDTKRRLPRTTGLPTRCSLVRCYRMPPARNVLIDPSAKKRLTHGFTITTSGLQGCVQLDEVTSMTNPTCTCVCVICVVRWRL